jgi:hypothetical protein
MRAGNASPCLVLFCAFGRRHVRDSASARAAGREDENNGSDPVH